MKRESANAGNALTVQVDSSKSSAREIRQLQMPVEEGIIDLNVQGHWLSLRCWHNYLRCPDGSSFHPGRRTRNPPRTSHFVLDHDTDTNLLCSCLAGRSSPRFLSSPLPITLSSQCLINAVTVHVES